MSEMSSGSSMQTPKAKMNMEPQRTIVPTISNPSSDMSIVQENWKYTFKRIKVISRSTIHTSRLSMPAKSRVQIPQPQNDQCRLMKKKRQNLLMKKRRLAILIS